MFSRNSTVRVGAVLVAAAAVVSGCSSGSSASTSSAGDSGVQDQSSSTATTDIDAIKVSGKLGAKPTIVIPTPFSIAKTTRKVVIPGTGAKVEPGQAVSMDYVAINGADDKQFDSSFDRTVKTTLTLDDAGLIKGLVSGVEGAAIGSRVLIAIPPADGYGTAGVSSAGIGPTDTLIFVVDIKGATTVLKRATGKAVAPKEGLPTVTLNKVGAPTITLPKGKAPTSLVVQPLIIGSGPKVAKNQSITVQYTGVVWPGGKVFDSSWAKGTPASFPIGAGRVIAGWDKGLVGQTIGSQIMLIVPPDDGYGATGQPTAGIKGTDTLVFVVDILNATTTAS